MNRQSFLKQIYKDSLSLLTDLYELTMAYAYWKNGLKDREAVFHLFFRKYPFQGAYAICAGTEIALDYINSFHFTKEDLDYLATLKNPAGNPLFEDKFLDFLSKLKMEVDVDGVKEGTPIFPNEPLLRVKGPIIQAQILESALLNIVNFQTLIATKSSRVCYAAKGDHVVEFGMRRAQGIDGAISAARAAYIGGCHSSSNVMAGKIFDIPVMGTLAHSFVMTFDRESDAFRAFAKAFPENCIFLIDTYDSIAGARKGIEVAREMGLKLRGVRLDSGDLHYLSNEVRKILDEEGMTDTKIMATNELTEQIISDLKHQGGKISLWGVGTNLVTAKDQPALDGVYKMSAVQDADGKWKYRLKISEQVAKTTNPGILQVRRFFDQKGYVADMLYDEEIGPGKRIFHHTDPGAKKEIKEDWEWEDLLIPMIKRGKRIYQGVSLEKIRERTYQELDKFPKAMRRFLNPQPHFCGLEEGLFQLKLAMIEELQSK